MDVHSQNFYRFSLAEHLRKSACTKGKVSPNPFCQKLCFLTIEKVNHNNIFSRIVVHLVRCTKLGNQKNPNIYYIDFFIFLFPYKPRKLIAFVYKYLLVHCFMYCLQNSFLTIFLMFSSSIPAFFNIII